MSAAPRRRPLPVRARFRHTYYYTRLETLDRGAPVSVYTVGNELGHGGDSLVKRVYGHLGEVRHRSEVVEYRIRDHVARLGERLTRLNVPGLPRLYDRASVSRTREKRGHQRSAAPSSTVSPYAPVAQLDRATAF